MLADQVRGRLSGLVLAVLDAGPAHGYAIAADLKHRTEGELAIPEGSLYPALHRLEQTGLVASEWDDSSGRRRRHYWLTPKGRAQLATEVRVWRQLRQAIDAVFREVRWPAET